MSDDQKLPPFHENALKAIVDLAGHIPRPVVLTPYNACLVANICVIAELAADSALPKGVAGRLADAWGPIMAEFEKYNSVRHMAITEFGRQIDRLRHRHESEIKAEQSAADTPSPK